MPPTTNPLENTEGVNGSGNQQGVEPQSLEYGGQPEYGSEISAVLPVTTPETPQISQVPVMQPQMENQPTPNAQQYAAMYPQDPLHPVSNEAAPEDSAPETYSITEGYQSTQQTSTEAQPSLYPQFATTTEQESIPKSEMPSLQERLVRQSREGEKGLFNENSSPYTSQAGGQAQPVVTQQQVLAGISGYPVSNTLSANPLSGLLHQTVSSGDPRSSTTWQAVIIEKIATVIFRFFPK